MGIAVVGGELQCLAWEVTSVCYRMRVGQNARYRLGDLIVMMIAASLCGAKCANEFSLFAQERKQALSRLVAYDVAPSHDTFSRLLRLIDPEAFAAFAESFARAHTDARDATDRRPR